MYGGPEETRTLDLSDANRTLSQLSYRPKYLFRRVYYNVYGTRPKAMKAKAFEASWLCSCARLSGKTAKTLVPSAGAPQRSSGNTHCNNVWIHLKGL